mgnify:CR=1 FL=1
MVSIVWFILSLFKVCAFTWLPVLIDSIILSFIIGNKQAKGDDLLQNIAVIALTGISIFAFQKFFFNLSVSNWWIIAYALLGGIFIVILPGGFTASNLILKHFGLMQLPTWGLIVGIVLDIIFIGVVFVPMIVQRKEKRER